MNINRAILKIIVQLFFLSIATAFIVSCATKKAGPAVVEESSPVEEERTVEAEKSMPSGE